MPQRAMVKLIHADNFYAPDDVIKYAQVVKGLKFNLRPYGEELINFNMIGKGLEPILSKVLGEKIYIDRNRSGIFRKPGQFIHFEDYESLDEWCFVVALEKTTFNMWYHLKSGLGEMGEINARSALEGVKFNYQNVLEWNLHTHVSLEPNQGIFFRPWVFHSWEQSRLVQYYRLIADKSLRILVMGLPSSQRRKLAKRLAQLLPQAVLVTSEQLRNQEQDVDYSEEGELRHAYRVLDHVSSHRKTHVVVDMTAPLSEQREIINPDLIFWVDVSKHDANKSRQELFTPPALYDGRLKRVTPAETREVVQRILSKNLW